MKKFDKRLDSAQKPIRIEGLDTIPVDSDGSVVPGTYTIYYVWAYGNVLVRTPRTFIVKPPDNGIQFRKSGSAGVEFTAGLDDILMIAIGSESPYVADKYTNVDLVVDDLQAWYVERDLDGNVTFETQVADPITIDDSNPRASLINDEIVEGMYNIIYSAEHEQSGAVFNNSITRRLKATRYAETTAPLTPLYTGRWEPPQLQTINLDCFRPASGGDPGVTGSDFPSNEDMTGIVPVYILKHRDTGEEIRFKTSITIPTFPSDIPEVNTTFLVEFDATNFLSGTSTPTELTQVDFDTFVVPSSPLVKKIHYATSVYVPPPPFTEITFTLPDPSDIIFQDIQSGSNPSPLTYYNGGLFPSQAQLLSNVTASYVDGDGVTQNLTVSTTRPNRVSRPGPHPGFFDGSEIKMHIPNIWGVTYSATAPDGTVKTQTRNVIIQDNVAPVFNKSFPTTVEMGTSYTNWVKQFHPLSFFGRDKPIPDYTFGIRKAALEWSISITPEEFNNLSDGDTFTATATTTDADGNSRTLNETIECVDTTAPTMRFTTHLRFPTGSNPTTQELEVGVTTSDLSSPVTLTIDDSTVNYAAAGLYTASYTATDSASPTNSRVRTRTVIVYGAPLSPPGPGGPVACPPTPGVANVLIQSSSKISAYSDDDWIEGLLAAKGEEDLTFDIVVDQTTVSAVPKNADGTIRYDLDSDGFTDIGVTTHFINYEIRATDGTVLLCTSRLIEIQDGIAPVINNVPNPLQVDVTAATTPDDVLDQIKTLIDVVDDVDGTNYILTTLEGITQSEVNTGADILKTLIFTDSSGNQSRTDTQITIQFNDVDADNDGIGVDRDFDDSDANIKTDIDGDGVGDPDSIVIWHHDFEDTLNYLEVRESAIDETPTYNGQASSAIFGARVSNSVSKRGVEISNNNFHIQTSNVGSAFGILSTNLSFAMSLETVTPGGGFSLENTDTGDCIYFPGSGGASQTDARMRRKIKRLKGTSTEDITYRFSIYHIREGLGTTTSDLYDGSRYTNETGSFYYNRTDLTGYTIENDTGVGELFGGESGDYQIEHYITNYDIPLDSQLHAYSFVFQPRTDGESGGEIAFFVDGELKQLLVKNDGNFGFTTNPVEYNLYGRESMFLSDYIWSTYTDATKILGIHNKMLSAAFTLTGGPHDDDDNDGLLNIEEDMIGAQFDRSIANTDATPYPGEPITDGLDDFIERHISEFLSPVTNTGVIGGRSFTASVFEDFTQNSGSFVNYFTGSMNLQGSHMLYYGSGTKTQQTISFWWYNDGYLATNGAIFADPDGQNGLSYNASSFNTNNYGSPSTSGNGSSPNFASTMNTSASVDGAQWKLFTGTFDVDTQEAKIYIDAQLFDTISNYRGGGSKFINTSGFTKWADLAVWNNVIFTQAKIQQVYDRAKEGEYDLRNKYPIIVNDPTGSTPDFSDQNVESDFTLAQMTSSLQFTSSYGAQDPKTVELNLHELEGNTSGAGTVAGTYTTVIETTSNEGLKTYTPRQTVVNVTTGSSGGAASGSATVCSPDLYFNGAATGSLIGNNTLTPSVGFSTTIGKYGSNSFDFGTSLYTQYAEFGPNITLASEYTFSFWFYNMRAGTSHHKNIISATPSTHVAFVKGGAGGGELRQYSGATHYSTGYNIVSAGLAADTWHHMALVASGSGTTFYVNGVEVGSTNVIPSGDLDYFGGISGLNQTFAQGMDELAYWEKPLPASQILTIYSSSVDLRAMSQDVSTDYDLYFNGATTGSTFGSNTLLAQNGASIDTTFGKYGSNSFNYGTSGFAQNTEFETPFELASEYTFSFWFYNMRTGTARNKNILTKSPAPTGTRSGHVAYVAQSSGIIKQNTGADSKSTGYDIVDAKLNRDVWHHMALVASGSGTTFYINGEQVGNNTGFVATGYVRELGGIPGALQTFAEAIDDFAYWERPLEPCEVRSIYDSKASLGSTTISHIEEDSSGTLNGNATLVNGVLEVDGVGDFVEIPHDTSYDRGSGDQTIHLWFNADRHFTPGETHHFSTMLSKYHGDSSGFGSVSFEGWQINLSKQSSMTLGGINVYENDNGTNQNVYVQPAGGVTLNQWNHLAVVKRATEDYEIYYNGAFLHSYTPTARSVSTTNNLIIGGIREYTGGAGFRNFFQGEIDGVTVVNEALTGSQISRIYGAGQSVTHIPAPDLYFDGSSTSSQIGSNSVSFVGTAALSTTNGKYGSDSFDFDTSGNNYLELSSDIMVTSGVYTFSLWYYNKRSHSNHGAILKTSTLLQAGAKYPMMTHHPSDELGVFDVEGTTKFFGSGYSLTDGVAQWTHLAVVADGATSTFYVNGEKVGNPVNRVIFEKVGRINGYSSQNQSFAEAIDEFAYWSVPLTAEKLK